MTMVTADEGIVTSDNGTGQNVMIMTMVTADEVLILISQDFNTISNLNCTIILI